LPTHLSDLCCVKLLRCHSSDRRLDLGSERMGCRRFKRPLFMLQAAMPASAAEHAQQLNAQSPHFSLLQWFLVAPDLFHLTSMPAEYAFSILNANPWQRAASFAV